MHTYLETNTPSFKRLGLGEIQNISITKAWVLEAGILVLSPVYRLNVLLLPLDTDSSKASCHTVR